MKTLLCFLLFISTLHAQQATLKPVTGKKVALVIGNNRYATSPLLNCVGDARAIAKVLREQLKFDTVLADAESEDLNRLAFTRRLQAFQKEAQDASVAVFYYAGHGMEDFDGRDNFLLPVDADLAEAAKDNAGLQAQGIPLDFVLKSMKDATQGAKILLLDCCRERPADRAVRTRDGGGFVMPADADMPQDTLIMLAAAPARTASDGDTHGPFTAALIKHLPAPGTTLFLTFRTVRNEVLTATQQQQKPWLKLDGAGDFFYDHLLVAGQAVENSPVSSDTTIMPGAPPVLPPRSPLESGAMGKAVDIRLGASVTIPLCFCPAGSFLMGSPADEPKRASYENQVQVEFTEPFWLARTELTQAQWSAVMGLNPSKFNDGDNMPVEGVSASDADNFIHSLNEKHPVKGWKWALPSEAQWEYACRAGTLTSFHFGNSLNGSEACCNGEFPYRAPSRGPGHGRTVRVMSYAPNEWGFYDMHGNVFEWCADSWDVKAPLPGGKNPLERVGSYRVFRGGSWLSIPESCRSAFRGREQSNFKDSYVGFRPALVRAY